MIFLVFFQAVSVSGGVVARDWCSRGVNSDLHAKRHSEEEQMAGCYGGVGGGSRETFWGFFFVPGCFIF